jgi:hypothetical protein
MAIPEGIDLAEGDWVIAEEADPGGDDPLGLLDCVGNEFPVIGIGRSPEIGNLIGEIAEAIIEASLERGEFLIGEGDCDWHGAIICRGDAPVKDLEENGEKKPCIQYMP